MGDVDRCIVKGANEALLSLSRPLSPSADGACGALSALYRPRAFADSRQAIIDQGQAIPSAPPLTITLLFIVLSFACLSLYYQLRVSAESTQRS